MKALLFARVLVIGVSAAAATEQSIAGVWYEEAHYDGARVISIADFHVDGSYRFLFRRCRDGGQEQDTVETGYWTHTNGRLKTVPDIPGMATNEYQTDSYDGRVWEYHHVAGYMFEVDGPLKFRDIRVQPGAKLPTCDTTS
jgi:hypothetical protein